MKNNATELYEALKRRENRCRRLADLPTTPPTTADEMGIIAATLNRVCRQVAEFLEIKPKEIEMLDGSCVDGMCGSEFCPRCGMELPK